MLIKIKQNMSLSCYVSTHFSIPQASLHACKHAWRSLERVKTLHGIDVFFIFINIHHYIYVLLKHQCVLQHQVMAGYDIIGWSLVSTHAFCANFTGFFKPCLVFRCWELRTNIHYHMPPPALSREDSWPAHASLPMHDPLCHCMHDVTVRTILVLRFLNPYY